MSNYYACRPEKYTRVFFLAKCLGNFQLFIERIKIKNYKLNGSNVGLLFSEKLINFHHAWHFSINAKIFEFSSIHILKRPWKCTLYITNIHVSSVWSNSSDLIIRKNRFILYKHEKVVL